MDPNIWHNDGAHFEDLAIWSPAATDYYSNNLLGFLTDHEPNDKLTTQTPADCFTTPHLPISFVGESSQGMVQFDQGMTSFGDLGYTCSSLSLSSGAGMDTGNNSQGTTNQLVVGLSSSSSSGPKPDRVEDRTYMRFSLQDVEKLIEGVKEHGRRWKSIKLDFFEDSTRKKDQLKEKWRHMLKSAHNQTSPTRKELYLKAKNVDANLLKYSRTCRRCRK